MATTPASADAGLGEAVTIPFAWRSFVGLGHEIETPPAGAYVEDVGPATPIPDVDGIVRVKVDDVVYQIGIVPE